MSADAMYTEEMSQLVQPWRTRQLRAAAAAAQHWTAAPTAAAAAAAAAGESKNFTKHTEG
jgi:hypothetical protein